MKNVHFFFFFADKNETEDGSLDWNVGVSVYLLFPSKICFFMLKKEKLVIGRSAKLP